MVDGCNIQIMKRFLLLLSLVALMSCVREDLNADGRYCATANKIINPTATPAPGLLLVRITEGASLPSYQNIEGVDISIRRIFPLSSRHHQSKLDRWHLLSFDDSADVKAIAEAVAKLDIVEVVEYESIIRRTSYKRSEHPATLAEPTRATEYPFNDKGLYMQWHYNNDGSISSECKAGADINLFNAWKYTAGDKRVIVAVIDGGIMTSHPDIKDNLWVNESEKNGLTGVDDDGNGYVDDIHGYNFVWNKGEITPDSHGTHVAGTISAVNNNEVGVCGIAGGSGKGDGVRLMSMQIYDGDESCFSFQIAEAFRYAADMGAVITNNSWGYEPYTFNSDAEYEEYDSVIKNAIDYFEENAKLEGVIDGGIAIFAAGNETAAISDYPGAYHNYVSVSAMAPNYKATYYTNYGPGTNICAPGGDLYYGSNMGVISTSTDGVDSYYEFMQGTSMAAPHVAGCAALAVSYAAQQGYTLTSDELRTLLLTSVQDINQYQTGTRPMYNEYWGGWEYGSLASYAGQLGSGYIDAHLLLMQMDGTPCLYFRTGEETLLSLDEYFGYGSKALTYQSIEISDQTREMLGIMTQPRIENGLLKLKCTKTGNGRIKVAAIIGGTMQGGNDITGGMVIEREFEIVARGSVATNGGWL